MSGVKISGKVKWFNNAKGYGFINEDGKEEDLFAHYSAITMEGYKTLKAGQLVTFEVIQGPKGLHAVEICAATAPPGKSHEDKHDKADNCAHSKKKQTA
ncbi:cold shock protein (beta-ribbon, CspA family) [Pseudomonas gessardii]|uniref:Cold shock-like protein CspD n=1 Tax=Pseudomonas gessardii TaxID=78544 RepID=A0A7Y1MRM7_9PSED|nr:MULTISPECIES: cold shock domain-containing protein CspD [Pseudomonas]MCF4981515.1 cold shock domain-containing protein CspD [Pseudomonas gessardii]MCF5085360.1 cold shock domain-containing protein CspD [Pseudomonas gessardii]MCF5095284.1 cold shock domain-containing protein CspD [Pseudomonas gessardii]MCF5107901.1 cold shock domain-containing protein CspD [Pseudomonas gessardii]MRU52307.1 cold shock domain-containing protein CspD [Pseudomonas gessardii]